MWDYHTTSIMRLNISDASWNYRIMGIDNGTNTLGVVVADHHLRTGVSTIIYARTLVAERSAYDRYPDLVFHRGKLAARLCVIRDFMDEVLDEFDPDVVGCESPFAHLHVHSYGTLLTSMNVIDECVYRYRHALEFVKVPPGRAKRAVCPGKFKSDKDYIRKCVLDDKMIKTTKNINLSDLDEHCIDATAVIRALAILEEPIEY